MKAGSWWTGGVGQESGQAEMGLLPWRLLHEGAKDLHASLFGRGLWVFQRFQGVGGSCLFTKGTCTFTDFAFELCLRLPLRQVTAHHYSGFKTWAGGGLLRAVSMSGLQTGSGGQFPLCKKRSKVGAVKEE